MSKAYTVKQVAQMSGVSVRTLHHYDQIGLLRPAYLGENRYRYYGDGELLRLQQILLHREMGIPLSDIAVILDAPDFDRLSALRDQREHLQAEAKRYARLVRTIDRTIASLNGDRTMKKADLYRGISPEKQNEYESWLVATRGGDMADRIRDSRRRQDTLAEGERRELLDELRIVEESLAEAMGNGVLAQATALDPLLERHHDWVTSMWNRPCPPDAYAGLADVYQSHPNFRARYEAIAPGFTGFLVAAMKAWARRQS